MTDARGQVARAEQAAARLRRTLSLPWLVFYGVGVTVGASIFALIGQILLLAGAAARYARSFRQLSPLRFAAC